MKDLERLRAELWAQVYAGIAASAGGSSDAALRWADRALKQFDERFKQTDTGAH